jgi:hypothetical protein
VGQAEGARLMILNIFKEIRLIKVRHDNTRMLINDLEERYLRLLREVQRLQVQKALWLEEKNK